VLSLSYAQPYVMAAVAPASIGRGIGVDIAVRHTTGPIPDLAALFDPLPAPTVREWTAIEAAVKADGRGLRIAPNEVQLSALTALAGVAEPAGVATLPGRATRISLWALPSPPGCIATLAIDPGDACNDDTS
jgi:4'-phosphopantetheinyl transferase